MPQVLAPGLELFGRFTDILAEPDECISEAVWIEIRQAGGEKRFAKNLADGRSAAPMGPTQPYDSKLAICPQRDERRGKERIVISPQLLLPEVTNPIIAVASSATTTPVPGSTLAMKTAIRGSECSDGRGRHQVLEPGMVPPSRHQWKRITPTTPWIIS